MAKADSESITPISEAQPQAKTEYVRILNQTTTNLELDFGRGKETVVVGQGYAVIEKELLTHKAFLALKDSFLVLPVKKA